MKRPLVCLLLASSFAGVHADNEIRSTQEELRRRNIYFGDIDGHQSGELTEALKRYQKRKGLNASGQDDHDTLRSLGIVPRRPDEPLPEKLELPDEPVLKSDAKINVAEEAHEIASTTGVSPASVAPDAIASGQTNGVKLNPRHDRWQPESAPKSNSHDAALAGSSGTAVPPDIQKYVRGYLSAVGGNRLEDELHFYADHVDYLANGLVDRRIIEHSLRKYYARWPHRSYSSPEDVSYRSDPKRAQILVTFRVTFSLRNGKQKAHGQTNNQIVINAATSDPRIVSIKEQRVRH